MKMLVTYKRTLYPFIQNFGQCLLRKYLTTTIFFDTVQNFV